MLSKEQKLYVKKNMFYEINGLQSQLDYYKRNPNTASINQIRIKELNEKIQYIESIIKDIE